MPLKFVFKDVSDTEKWCPTEGSRRRSPGKIHAWRKVGSLKTAGYIARKTDGYTD